MFTFTAPVDGGWGEFGDWTSCSKDCGGGKQQRSRECSNPAPANVGNQCVGDATEERDCNTEACPGMSQVKILSVLNLIIGKLR